MNREIKFRAWDDGKEEWLMGYEMPNLGGFSMFGEMVLLGEWSAILNEFLFDRNGHKADDLKLMQFIGFRDKNGREIFEGDIVRDEQGAIGVVEYSAPDFIAMDVHADKDGCAGCGNVMIFPNSTEVIGNVYQNPELLKVEKINQTTFMADYIADPEGGMKEKGTAEAASAQPAAVTEQPKVESESETTVAAEETKPEETTEESGDTTTETESSNGEKAEEEVEKSED